MPAVPGRILIIRPSALGDVCRTVSVLAALRRAWPSSRIDWIVQDSFIDAVREHPALGAAIPFPRQRWRRWWMRPSTVREVLSWHGSLRDGAYDLVLDCQGLARSAVASWCSRAPRRLVRAGAREGAWLGATQRVSATGSDADALAEMMALVEALGIDSTPDPRLHAPAADRAWWGAERATHGLAGPFVALAPTSRWPGKLWDPARWGALARALRGRGLSLCAIGAPGEEEQVRAAVGGIEGCVNLCGRLSIGRMMALLSTATLAVAHDSAAIHVAAGVGAPYVGVFGPTDPRRTGPWQCSDWCLWGGHGERLGAHEYRDARRGQELMARVALEDVLARCLMRLPAGVAA